MNTSISTLALRFAARSCSVHNVILGSEDNWFIIDENKMIVDVSCSNPMANSFLGRPLSTLVRGGYAGSLDAIWPSVEMGRAQAVWPWTGGNARVINRSIELHPIFDNSLPFRTVIGAIAIVVGGDHQVSLEVA
ncbi:MAG: hypothetical protein ACOH1J_02610 [Microbacteriaceae bacterium]